MSHGEILASLPITKDHKPVKSVFRKTHIPQRNPIDAPCIKRDTLAMTQNIPRQITANAPELPAILTLIRDSFGYMDDRIDPPSSMHQLTLDTLTNHTHTGEVWAIGAPPLACVFFSFHPGALHIGKLAVASHARGQGHARALIALAQSRAQARQLPFLELQTRIELTENHATFTALGFTEGARTAHRGYDHPTSITYRRPVPRGSTA